LYIIENKLGHYYTGICKDVSRRFSEHQGSGIKCAKALKGKGPLSLIFCCQLDDHSSALKMELWVKSLNKDKKIRLVGDSLNCDFFHCRLSPSTFTKTEAGGVK
ncbi:MAG: putative endonuclease, partial [Paraglaciecola sp.]